MALPSIRILSEFAFGKVFIDRNSLLKSKLGNCNGVKYLRNTINCSCVRNTHEYCLDTVRRFDYENFLSTLLLPKEVRAAAFAVRAFNVEIAQVRDMVHDKKIGEMRMQFWKEAIDKIFSGDPPHQPVAMELAKVLRTKRLSKHWFQRMIASRQERLSDHPFVSINELEEYSEKAISSSYYLILESMGVKNVQADHVASHAGKSQGIANLVRGIPFNAKHGRVYLPSDVMIKHNLSQEDILRGAKEAMVGDLICEISSAAHRHLERAESLKKDIPKESILVFLPLVPIHIYLKQLERYDFNVFHPHLQRRNAWLPLHLWLKKIKNN